MNSVSLVLPVAGHPICLRQIEEQIRHTRDGSVITEEEEKLIYRDLVGRVCIEPSPKAHGDSASTTTTIVDPVNGFLTILDPSTKTAVRLAVPSSRPDQFGFSLPGLPNTIPGADWTTVSMPLETRMIEGIEFAGMRITSVSQELQPSRIVYEWWASKAIGLISSATAFTPNDEHTCRIQQIEWRAQDPEWFAIPLDYTTHELKLPNPDDD